MSDRFHKTWCFVLVVVRMGRRFLVVQEAKPGRLWYLPAGRVEPGESFFEAAHRETMEEAGIPVVLEGVVRVEHAPNPDGTARLRVIFVARPADDSPPKSVADSDSVQARWVTLEELDKLSLRGMAFRELFHYISGGGTVYPLNVLSPEGTPFRP